MEEPLLLSDIAALMRHAVMSATYKPALLKALVRVCRRSQDLQISLEALGDEFAKMYWNQVVTYHLRQAASTTKEAEVIKLIRKTAEDYGVRFFVDLPDRGRAQIKNQMAKILTINVLDAFHTSKPKSMPDLFRWEKSSGCVVLSAEALAFIRTNDAALELIANYYWAEFLEACNRLAPRVIQKVSRDFAKRRSLVQYLAILSQEDDKGCFYCGRAFAVERRPAVDHVIPWSFLLEDPIWDLVLACAACNSAKSDWLPRTEFVDRLVKRNKRRALESLKGKASLLFGADDVTRLYEAAISLEWPGFWGPAA
jgi:5-methylcytosine-specific restriction endonuclease McrA